MNEIVVYSRSGCRSCEATKNLLKKLGVDFTEVNIEEDPESAQWLVDQGWRAVPVVTTENEAWSGFQPKKLQELAVV